MQLKILTALFALMAIIAVPVSAEAYRAVNSSDFQGLVDLSKAKIADNTLISDETIKGWAASEAFKDLDATLRNSSNSTSDKIQWKFGGKVYELDSQIFTKNDLYGNERKYKAIDLTPVIVALVKDGNLAIATSDKIHTSWVKAPDPRNPSCWWYSLYRVYDIDCHGSWCCWRDYKVVYDYCQNPPAKIEDVQIGTNCPGSCDPDCDEDHDPDPIESTNDMVDRIRGGFGANNGQLVYGE